MSRDAEMAATTRRGLWLALGSVMLMAAWYPTMKLVMGRISPIQAASIEAIGLTATSALWGRLRGQRQTAPPQRGWVAFASLNTIALVLLYLSLQQLSPIIVSLTGRLYVVVCAVLAVAVLRERIGMRDWTLILISSAATVAFLHGQVERASVLGIVAATAYVVCFAIANLVAKRFGSGVAPATTLLWSRGLAALTLPLLGLMLEGQSFLQVDPSAAAWVLGSSITTMFGGLMLYYRALGMAPFALVNVLRALGPLFVFVYSMPFASTPLTWGQCLSGIICIASVALLSSSRPRTGDRDHTHVAPTTTQTSPRV